jgi:lactoylglutathione lyase
MKIHHVAIWVKDLDKIKEFYMKYFKARAGKLYFNPTKDFRSYFLTFEGGCKIEIMHSPLIQRQHFKTTDNKSGYTHIAVSAGSRQKVEELTERLRNDGYKIIGEPRTTGDGFYESVILDPENNRIEITV